ncbi:MAG: hypothetical protein KC464_08950, partial [Myxococcales bacterium]|nr:hypothetical protein [Myxococcales bacterium]
MRDEPEVHEADLERLFRVDGAGPALPASAARADAMIAAALDAVLGPMPGGGGGGSGGSGGGGAGSGVGGTVGVKAAWVAAIAAVLAGGAVVAYLVLRPPAATKVEVPAIEVAEVGTGSEPASGTGTGTGTGTGSEPASGTGTGTGSEPASGTGTGSEPEADYPEIEVDPEPRRATHDRPRHDDLDDAGVDDLLARANQARGARKWRDADALYARVVAEHGDSASAQVALVASAALHLEHLGDARGAARRYRDALGRRARGGVAEEARYGLAEAYRALGDATAE